MTLSGEYAPSSQKWVRDQVAAYEASGGAEANTLRGSKDPIVVITSVGHGSGKLRKNPVMRVERDGKYVAIASKGGAADDPTWADNFRHHPEVDLQDGPEVKVLHRARARGRTGARRLVAALGRDVGNLRGVPEEDRPPHPSVPPRAQGVSAVELPGWTLGEHTYDGTTHPTYRRGSGPGVVVIHEIPGITPQVKRFAEELVDAGYTVVMPHLFGTPGQRISALSLASAMKQVCVSREFTELALRETAPVAGWLRSLARELHAELGGPGVGAIGMCFTGGFALAMMVDDSIAAPVLAQPSAPFIGLPGRSADLNLSPADLEVVKRRAAECQVLGLRFEGDLAVGKRFDTLRRELGSNFLAVELARPPALDRDHAPQAGVRRRGDGVLRRASPGLRFPSPAGLAGLSHEHDRTLRNQPDPQDQRTRDVGDLVGEWLSWSEAAEQLGVSVSKVRQLIKDHHLAALVPAPGAGQKVPAALLDGREIVKGVPGLLTVLRTPASTTTRRSPGSSPPTRRCPAARSTPCARTAAPRSSGGRRCWLLSRCRPLLRPRREVYGRWIRPAGSGPRVPLPVDEETSMSGLAALLAGHNPPDVYQWHSAAHVPDVQHAVEHAGWSFVTSTAGPSRTSGLRQGAVRGRRLPGRRLAGRRRAERR